MIMNYFYVEAEVAGGIGPHSVVHESPGQLRVDKLHYVFDGWAGDEILESTPCYIVSTKLSDLIRSKHLSGIVFGEVEISCSELFHKLYPNRIIPSFVWMKIIGIKRKDDFFQAENACLVVSEHAWNIIKPFANHAIVTNFAEYRYPGY
jgi:hypothetical protein